MIKHFLLFVAVASPLIAQQYPSPPSGPCTDASLRNPSWNVSDWEDQGDTLIFRLQNNANNYTSVCYRIGGQGGQCFWADDGPGSPPRDDDIQTRFSFDGQTRRLNVGQTWLCTDIDPSHPVNFTATGNARVQDDCTPAHGIPGEICLVNGSATLHASLTSPIETTYIPPALPRSHDAPGCNAASVSPSWKISNFQFRSEPYIMGPLGLPLGWEGFLSFNITNTATNDTVECSVQSLNLGLYRWNISPDDRWYDCDSTPHTPESFPPDVFETRPEYATKTFVRWDKAAGKFEINQTLHCDEQTTEVVSFTTYSESIVSLKCTTEEENPISMNDDCTTVSPFVIRGVTVSRTELPPNAFSFLDPTAPSCTVSSFYARSLSIENFSYSEAYFNFTDGQEPSHPAVWRFKLVYDHAVIWQLEAEAFMERARATEVKYPRPVQPLYLEEKMRKQGEVNITYQLDEWHRIFFNMTWTCSDIDPTHPVSFNATGSALLPFNCTRHPECGANNTCDSLQCETIKRVNVPLTVLPFKGLGSDA